ncbi:MAG TPA: hypothetical protein VL326_15525 [Kofleriaceae bacterium]|nr:hypothetical protein [Kofleriaceae bacterium]
MGRALLSLLVLAACTPSVAGQQDAPITILQDGTNGPDPNDGARSGTRLKLTWYQLADGTRQWDGFYDAQRKENCYIYDNWIDGKAYCTPDYDGSIVYSNATCTTKVAEVYKNPTCPTQQPQPYTLEWNYTPCESQPAHLWTRGAKLTLASYYYKSSDGTCGGPYTTSTSYDYYAIGTEVKTSDIVQVVLGTPVGEGRLLTRYWQSSDGMQRQAVVHDTAFGDTCYPGATGCQPTARYVSYEENATCTTPKLSIPKTCAVPKFAVYYPNNACYSDPGKYYVLGALTAGAPLYYYNGTTCTTQTPSTTSNYYKMGSALTLSPTTEVIGTEGQRIQLVHYTNPEGLNYRSSTLYDAQKGAECYPTKLPDGTIRCVVYGGYVDTYYKDAMCTQTIDLVTLYTGGASCAIPTPPKYARKYITPAPGSCTYNTAVYNVGGAYTTPVYENNGTCVVHPTADNKLYSLGSVVPLTDFITASITIDP